jgi:uncharacterized protein (DUF1697 family)
LEGGVQRYFGFLRAVNVGGRQIKMTELAQALTDMGLTDAETFIASGNVVFKSDAGDETVLRETIEAGMTQRFGFPVQIFLRTRDALEAVVQQVCDETIDTDIAINIAFTHCGEQGAVAAALAPWQSDLERFSVKDGYFLWFAKTKMSETAFFKKGYAKKSVPVMTIRNNNTIERMLAKWDD